MAHRTGTWGIRYSAIYKDDDFEYRHAIMSQKLFKANKPPTTMLMTETDWRNLGIQVDHGWVHYMIHGPEPHIILFRRPLEVTTQRTTITQPESESIATSQATTN